MALRPITANTRFIKMADAKSGDVFIKKGTLMETRPGKFGDTLIFSEENGEEVGLGAGGQLKSLYSRGKLKVGGTYQIIFKGKVSLKDGRTANDFDVAEHEDESDMEDDGDYLPEDEA